MKEIHLILIMFILRWINLQMNNQDIWPDEEYQILEPAYDDVFGGGYRTWEWNQDYPIRNPFVVIIVGIYYRILKVLNLDFSFLVAYGSRYFIILPSILIMDYCILLIVRMLFKKYGKSNTLDLVVIFMNMTNEFSVKYGTRVFYNTFEAVLTALGIYLWFKSGRQFSQSTNKNDQKSKQSVRNEIYSRVILTINFMIRSSCLIIWPLSFIFRMFWQWTAYGMTYLYTVNSLHMHISIIFPFLLDLLYFRKITYTVWNFIQWNVIENNSKIFGTSEYEFFVKKTYPNYFNEQFILLKIGIALVIFDLNLYLIRFLMRQKGKKKQVEQLEKQQVQKIDIKKQERQIKNENSEFIMRVEMLVMFVLYNLAQFSSPHKEHRFLFGIYPLMAVFVSYSVLTIIIRLRLPLFGLIILFLTCFKNINIHYRDCLFKNQYRYQVADYIRLYQNKHKIKDLGIFIGCYAMPSNSHYHIKGAKIHIIDCNVGGKQEAKMLHQDSYKFIIDKVKKIKPTHLLLKRDPKIVPYAYLGKLGYVVVKEFYVRGKEKPNDNDRLFLENKYVNDY